MPNLVGQSTQSAMAAVKGENTGKERASAGGEGVLGVSVAGCGVRGVSTSGRGVVAESDTDYALRASSRTMPGIRSSSAEARAIEGWGNKDDGVWGISKLATGVHGVSEGQGTGVVGESKVGRGVHGASETWQGVFGFSRDNAGIVGESTKFHAVFGHSHSSNNGGVIGINDAGGWGVIGRSKTNTGVSGESDSGVGVHGRGGRLAGFFEGDVEVTGDIRLANADCAEDFDVYGTDKVEPGTVMVLGEEGALLESQQAYDKRVAGVISGAGDFKPGIILDTRQSQGNRQPVALMGKVFCKVDAQFGAIEVGDLLTTSPTPGHAMKTDNPFKAFGAVIGKALRPLTEGQALIPILIALQ